MARVLLINPSYTATYGSAKISILNPIFPTLGLATIAAAARQRGHSVRILDLCWRGYDFELIRSTISAFKPDIVGVTVTTPHMNQMRDVSVLAKDISSGILVVVGGAHPSALPAETLRESLADIVVTGEGDLTFPEICDGRNPAEIQGIYCRDGGNVLATSPRTPIGNLDSLPMPAWDLYDPKDYLRISRVMARRPPATMAEFSRGCVFKCDFCATKMTMSQGYRRKSPARCAAEVKEMHRLGFREFMLADDIFTMHAEWATEVSEAIRRSGVDMAWTCTNGIRVESARESLFRAMRRAGCYRVSFGLESGSDEVLAAFGKGGHASLTQGQRAVRLARAAGLDTNGFFVLGLSPDTEATMRQTIEFARRLPLDMMKFSICVGFPGTPMFAKYAREGKIRSYDWDEYYTYTDKALFVHDHLSHAVVQRYMTLAYRWAILLNPGLIWRRFLRGIRTGDLFFDIGYWFRFAFLPAYGDRQACRYYAPDRWPVWDFTRHRTEPASYQVISHTS